VKKVEAKIIYDWDEFEREFEKLEEPKFYINLDTTKKGNVLRIYAETEDVVLIFEPEDMDLRKWKQKLDDMQIDYKWGKSPVKIIESE
jgi:hypothetical protein